MEDLKLCESDYRFMTIIWDAEPVSSRQLVELAAQQLGWKKSTTYTVLKKLVERGFARNEDSRDYYGQYPFSNAVAPLQMLTFLEHYYR